MTIKFSKLQWPLKIEDLSLHSKVQYKEKPQLIM